MIPTINVVAQHNVSVFTLNFTAVQAEAGFFYACLNEFYRTLKLNPVLQTRIIKGHLVLQEGYCQGLVEGKDGEKQMQDLLRIDFLTFWVTQIPIDHLDEPFKTKVINFQREAAFILQEAMATGLLNGQEPMADLLRLDWPEVSAYKDALNKLNIARSQLLVEANSRRRLELFRH
jgi:hypothetical protein